MISYDPVYILGAGAIGFPLALHLANAGRPVMAVRTSRRDLAMGTALVSVDTGTERLSATVATISIDQLAQVEGVVVVTSKAHANPLIARELIGRATRSPLVIMQNGVGVEQPFLDAGFAEIYRCILYITGQTLAENCFAAYAVKPSPIGIIRGDAEGLGRCVRAVSTEQLPFCAEANIQREIWRKAIINVVFNSICALLDADNGVFVRDEAAAEIAREVVRECIALTDRLQIGLGEDEMMEQILWISRWSSGQLPSTLQDLRGGRPTEIDSLNLAVARVAAELRPSLALPRTELLGRLIAAKGSRPGPGR